MDECGWVVGWVGGRMNEWIGVWVDEYELGG